MVIETRSIGKCTYQDTLKGKSGTTLAVLTVVLAEGQGGAAAFAVHVDYDSFSNLPEDAQQKAIKSQIDLDGDDRRILKIGNHGKIVGVRFEEDGSPLSLEGLPISGRRLTRTAKLIEFDDALELAPPSSENHQSKI